MEDITIDISNCKNGLPESIAEQIRKSNEGFKGTIYVYDNDMNPDEPEFPYSVTMFKPGDRVKARKSQTAVPSGMVKERTFVIQQICPATYGFMNVFCKDDETGKTEMFYSGDIVKVSKHDD